MTISEKSMTYLFGIHFKNKKIHEMQKIFHEVDFFRVEVEKSGFWAPPDGYFEQGRLPEVVGRFFLLSFCKYLFLRKIDKECVRCKIIYPNPCCAGFSVRHTNSLRAIKVTIGNKGHSQQN